MEINRRVFLRNTALAGISGLVIPRTVLSAPLASGELLYNGIQLPKAWPPRNLNPAIYDPMEVPYLSGSTEIYSD